jgi:cell division protein FtsL
MTGKLNVVLTVLLVGCALSVVNARYQRNHLVNDIEKLVPSSASSTSTGPSSSSTSPPSARTSASSRSRARNLNMAPLSPARTQYLTEGGK